jgi:hypothetical protein
LWGEAKREIRGLMSEKNLAPFLRRTLSSIDAEITRDNLNPNPNRAAFYRELFTTGDRLPVLEAMARRKGPAAESCQRLVSLFMVADRADGEVRLREKANLLRALAAVLPKGAELVYASTDVMASRLGVLGTAEGEEGCLATETRRVVEDEVRVAPKGRAGGGGGPVAGTATAAPAAGRSKSK